MPTYPHGFPEEIIREYERLTGRKVLCNRPYSGTDVIRDYGEQAQENGGLIVYTSADSVSQVAAHEETVPVEELYRCCRLARKLMTGEHGVGRDHRPSSWGETGSYRELPAGMIFPGSARRHSFDRIPAQPGLSMLSVGKIDIFAGRGVTEAYRTENNAEGIERAVELTRKDFNGFMLCEPGGLPT